MEQQKYKEQKEREKQQQNDQFSSFLKSAFVSKETETQTGVASSPMPEPTEGKNKHE